MDSASFQLVLFGIAVAIISNFSRKSVWRSVVLMLASLVFLAQLAKNPVVFIPLAGFLLLGYGCLLLIRRGLSKAVTVSVLGTVLVYVWLKKYTFLPEGILLHFPYFTLGLSYIFFRVLHVIIESGDSDKMRVGFGGYLLYTLNFTTFVSGPIQRYDEFARDQFAVEPVPLGARVIGLQLERIIRGFFKVNVLAMLLDAWRQDALAQLSQPLPLQMRMFSAVRLVILYPLFLYSNFSGYIDIVIALARLMRLRLPENFDRPFSAPSVMDFWNRWHITLSTWFKTYLYNPMIVALMRRVSSPTLEPLLGVFCFFVTFFFVGIWHGRTSEYLVYGLVTGLGISVNKLWQLRLTSILGRKGYKGLAKNALYIAFARGLNFSWFAFTLFWFWADWAKIGKIFSSFEIGAWVGIWAAIWVSTTAVLALWEWLRAALLSIKTAEGPVLTSRYALVVYASVLGLTALFVTVMLNQPAPGIVYKAF
jgi:D-alanyl-lipoteichoic acid acyltransferase DltB (MBOAT superfamily)